MSATDRVRPLKVQRQGNVTIVTFSADAVRDVENVLARELGGLEPALGGHLLLDMCNVRYLNSIELGTLISLHQRARLAGGHLTMFNLDPQLRKLLSITRLDTLLAICEECAAAGAAV